MSEYAPINWSPESAKSALIDMVEEVEHELFPLYEGQRLNSLNREEAGIFSQGFQNGEWGGQWSIVDWDQSNGDVEIGIELRRLKRIV